MNRLKPDKQEAVIAALVEGASIRSIERMTGVHRDTIMRLMVRVGNGCERLLDSRMRGLSCERIQIDELWCFVGKKQRHVKNTDNPELVGEQWVFVALDADSKLIPSYKVGKRSSENATNFLVDLSSRLENRIQLSSDSMGAYVDAVEAAFGSDVDYGQIVKAYEAEPMGAGRYSPPHVIKVKKFGKIGWPNQYNISTSYVERQNLTMRMSMRRFTRLTNAYSKKLENLKAAVALHFAHYNFVRIHQSIKATPAMAAGISSNLWTIRDLLDEASI